MMQYMQSWIYWGGGGGKPGHWPGNLGRMLNYERALIVYLIPSKKYARPGPGYTT